MGAGAWHLDRAATQDDNSFIIERMSVELKPDVRSLIREGAELTEQALDAVIPTAATVPASIHGAMRHSVFAGGKRLRPVLAIQAAAAVAGKVPEGIGNLGA